MFHSCVNHTFWIDAGFAWLKASFIWMSGLIAHEKVFGGWGGGGVVFIWLHPKYHCPHPSSPLVTRWTEDNGGDSCPTWWFFLLLNTTKQIKRIQLSTTDRFTDNSSWAQRTADNSYSSLVWWTKCDLSVSGCFKETSVLCKRQRRRIGRDGSSLWVTMGVITGFGLTDLVVT